MSDQPKIDGGGSAFPLPSGHARVKGYQAGVGEYSTVAEVCTTGMSLRQFYAASALPGLYPPEVWKLEFSREEIAAAAQTAFAIADAMIAAGKSGAK